MLLLIEQFSSVHDLLNLVMSYTKFSIEYNLEANQLNIYRAYT